MISYVFKCSGDYKLFAQTFQQTIEYITTIYNVATTIVRSSTVNNVVETVLSTMDALTMLFSHDNNIDHMLFDEQCCINLINFYACSVFRI